jgi:ribokinase
LQLQQSWEANLEAARIAKAHQTTVVVDGAPPTEAAADPDELFALTDVWRTDQHETQLLTGLPVDTAQAGVEAAWQLLERGPSVIAVAAGDADVIVWADEQLVIPHQNDRSVIDTTGAGDAFVAGLITGLLETGDPAAAGCLAVAAASQVVTHLGGRPHLQTPEVREEAARQQWLELRHGVSRSSGG